MKKAYRVLLHCTSGHDQVRNVVANDVLSASEAALVVESQRREKCDWEVTSVIQLLEIDIVAGENKP